MQGTSTPKVFLEMHEQGSRDCFNNVRSVITDGKHKKNHRNNLQNESLFSSSKKEGCHCRRTEVANKHIRVYSLPVILQRPSAVSFKKQGSHHRILQLNCSPLKKSVFLNSCKVNEERRQYLKDQSQNQWQTDVFWTLMEHTRLKYNSRGMHRRTRKWD